MLFGIVNGKNEFKSLLLRNLTISLSKKIYLKLFLQLINNFYQLNL